MIEIKNVTKAYGPTVVVDGVDLELREGGVTAIIGPNGAGKSTLLSMVARLLGLDGGEVFLDGKDVHSYAGRDLAQRLSILRQDNHIMSRLTVRELISFGRYPYSQGRINAKDQRKIADAMRYMDLDPLAGRYLDELSGGQRQRAFVAMVLCQDTQYVLLDEPLNNLDMKHAVAMMGMIRRTADELGKTVVLVIHDINFASAYADTIVAMKDGVVVADGTSGDIMRQDVLRDIYDIDIEIADVSGKRVAVYY